MQFDILEENIIFNLKNFTSKILPTITVCGSALFLMHGKVSADQIDNTNSQNQNNAQTATMNTATSANSASNNDNNGAVANTVAQTQTTASTNDNQAATANQTTVSIEQQ